MQLIGLLLASSVWLSLTIPSIQNYFTTSQHQQALLVVQSFSQFLYQRRADSLSFSINQPLCSDKQISCLSLATSYLQWNEQDMLSYYTFPDPWNVRWVGGLGQPGFDQLGLHTSGSGYYLLSHGTQAKARLIINSNGRMRSELIDVS